MIKPLYCIIDNQSGYTRDQQRERATRQLELEQDKTIPIFEEATQTAASLLKVPICTLGILLNDEYIIKSAYGLSTLGLSNDLVRTRKIPRNDSFAVHVIDSSNCLVVENAGTDSFFSSSILTQHYHIMAYLGVPITVSNGQCIGCLEVLALEPRQFSQSDIDILNVVARWCLAEYECNYLEIKSPVIDNSLPMTISDISARATQVLPKSAPMVPSYPANLNSYTQQLTLQLINQLIQKLSIPLTSVIGMSSVLRQGIYGTLNQKQEKYLNIVYNSGQEMTNLVEEITNLAHFKPDIDLKLAPVDLANLGNQVIASLEIPARNREHSLRLSIEPGEKVWQLDREKVKQTLFYLLSCIIEGSRTGGEISVHISQRAHQLNINCWVRHPWLGEGISFDKINLYHQAIKSAKDNYQLSQVGSQSFLNENNYDYDVICLLFASYLVQIQAGNIELKGSPEAGYRFLLFLPIS